MLSLVVCYVLFITILMMPLIIPMVTIVIGLTTSSKKLLFYLSYDELYVKRGIFWSHNTGFNHNNGHIYGKIYICRNKAIRFGKSHLWHKKYFPPFTKLCGVVTCIVTSKSLVLMLLNFLGVI